MCTSFMSTWEAKLPDIEQRIAFVFVARSPIARLIAAKKARGWTQHKIYSDPSGDYTRDYVSAADADAPGYSVFTRRDGSIRHFWSGEMGPCDRRPRTGPARRAGYRSAVDHSRHHARGPRQGLVSAPELLKCGAIVAEYPLKRGNFRNSSMHLELPHSCRVKSDLTKSRLNDAPCLCEIGPWNFLGAASKRAWWNCSGRGV